MRSFTLVTAVLHLIVLETTCYAQEWSIRLRGGRTPFEGRVEVLLGSHWGTIEDSHWDFEDAMVVCSQLGFTAAEAATVGGVFPPADWSTPVLLSNVECVGGPGANSLSECSYGTVTNHYYTTHSRDAGVRCAVELSVRLHNTTDGNIGRLDIQHGGVWSPVCADSWEKEEATVACRQLGYHHSVSIQGMNNSGAVSVPDLNCTGQESRLLHCQSPLTILNTCSGGRSIQLECAGAPLPPHPPLTSFPSCSSASLTWSPPPDRGLTVHSYSLRYRPLPQPSPHTTPLLPWTNMSIPASGAEIEAVTIDDLQTLTEYEFQVSAVNSAGASPFSDSTIVTTPAPKLGAPGQVQVDSRGQTAAEISWTEPMTCGIDSLTYEVLYSIEGRSSISFQDSVSPTPHNTSSPVQYMLQGLLPYTHYSVKVRVVGYVDGGDGMYRLDNGTFALMGRTVVLSSNYSDATLFTTQKSAPSGSPQAFVAFFSILQSAAHFKWDPVSPHLANGVILSYIISCRSYRDGSWELSQYSVDNSTFKYSVENLHAATQYECSVAARNEVGQGPDSTPILLITPADLNQRPSAPRNVAFAIVEPNSDKDTYFVEATWEMFMCESNFSCVELLGYVIVCREDRGRSTSVNDPTAEVRKTLWLSDYQTDDDVYEAARVPVKSFTRYDCSMASMNTYGVGQSGSRVSVVTPETRPTQSPMQFYFTNLQSDSVRVHWVYSESPRTGMLIGFIVYTYEQDTRFPEREGGLVIREVFSLMSNQDSEAEEFSYQLMYLKPGFTYNVFVSAITTAGEGPRGRTSLTTLRTAPIIVPENVLVTVSSSMTPFPVTIQWSLTLSSSIQQANHIGFLVHCYDNMTGVVNELLTHNVLDDQLTTVYSTSVLLPAECGGVNTYQCAVAAFNERGEGQRSEPGLFVLPCNVNGGDGSLSASFLADPYYGITFLALIILLFILLIISLVFCGLCIARYERRVQKEEQYSTVPYDEGYISMAPSGSNSSAMKPTWLRSSTHYPSPGVAGRLNTEQEDFSHYDEIPGERVSKNENVYDEIPLRLTPIPPGRSNNSSMRSSPAIQHIVTCPSIHSVSSCHSDNFCELDESQVTTVTNIAKSDNHTTGTMKLSTLSSEESLAKGTEMESEVTKPPPFKHQSPPSVRGRKSGYVEVVTTKDGKRCIRELDRALPQIAGASAPRDQTRGKSAERSPLQDQSHSYQNVAEIKRPKSASSARAIGILDDQIADRKSWSNHSRVKQVTSADFQLSTVTDSDV